MSFDFWHLFKGCSTAVEWCLIFASPIAFKRMHPSMVLDLSLLTTGLPALGRLPPADAPNSRLFPSHWCFAGHAIHPSLRSNISFLELFSIFISDRRFGAVWTNKRVFLETENTQALLFINKGTCKTPIAMSWLREIFCLSVRHNFHLLERHFPCWYNRQADRLSRLIQSASFSNYGSFSHS